MAFADEIDAIFGRDHLNKDSSPILTWNAINSLG